MLRKLRYGALVPVLATIAMLANMTPSSANLLPDAVGAGVVVGGVLIRPAVPGLGRPCIATRFTFRSTQLIGAVVDLAEPGAAVGALNVSAHGGSPCEVFQSAGGTVQVLSISPATPVTGSILLCNENELRADVDVPQGLQGAFVRVGPVVVVDIAGDLNINQSAEEDCEEVDVSVAALFVPPPLGGLPKLGVHFADFAGVFDLVSFGDSRDGDAGDCCP